MGSWYPQACREGSDAAAPERHPAVVNESWNRLVRRAAASHGVVARSDAPTVGVALATFDRRVRKERWRQPHTGVALLPGSADTPRQRIAGALAAVGPHAAASHDTALFLYGLTQRTPAIPTVLVPHGKRAVRDARIRTVRTRTLVPGDVVRSDRLPVTSAVRTMIDVAPGLSLHRLLALILAARQRRLLDVERLAGRLLGPCPTGSRGRLTRALSQLGSDGSESILERLVRGLLYERGLRPEVAPHPVRTALGPLTVDIAFLHQRLAIECEGFAYHRTRDDLERDQRRFNALAAAGWRVLRASWQRVHEDPESLVDEVIKLLGD